MICGSDGCKDYDERTCEKSVKVRVNLFAKELKDWWSDCEIPRGGGRRAAPFSNVFAPSPKRRAIPTLCLE